MFLRALFLVLFCVCSGSAFAVPKACALGDVVPPEYGETSRRFTHTLKAGPRELELRTDRRRASDGSELVRYTLHEAKDGEELGGLTFEFVAPGVGKFRGVELTERAQGAGLGELLYRELAKHPEFQGIDTITSKYIGDNERGMNKALAAMDVFGGAYATPDQLMKALTAIDPKTNRPYVAATNLWGKIGFRPKKVWWDKTFDQFMVEFERVPVKLGP